MSQQLALDLGDGLQRLEALLEAEDRPPGRMTLSALDGFIAAIAAGPDFVPPSEWMPLVWGDEAPVFGSQDEAQAVLGALMELYNEIVRDVQDGSYVPHFQVGEDGETDVNDWCAGFLMGALLRPRKWRRFIDSRHGFYLLPVYAHLPELTGGAVGPDDLDGFDPHVDIPVMVMRLYDHWRGGHSKGRGGTAASSFSSSAKTGRNDPCPCGSGRKFKLCCLNADAAARALPGLPG